MLYPERLEDSMAGATGREWVAGTRIRAGCRRTPAVRMCAEQHSSHTADSIGCSSSSSSESSNRTVHSESSSISGSSDGGSSSSDVLDSAMARALLDALDVWLRSQTVASVLPKEQAKALLQDLRDDRRFWAQQRRQFATLWVSIEEGMRLETRPLVTVLGPETTKRLLEAVEQMDDDPALINSILRSEVVEKVIGHVLYEGIFEFVQRADLLGNIVNSLPVIGPIRVQMIKAARAQLDALLGAQLAKFLGEYTAAAAESAVDFVLSEETADLRRKAKRKACEKLLAKPINELLEISDLEMVLVRDAVWSAVQEFRLPNEDELVDRLYAEFGHQPFTILLPSNAVAERGDAPLFERGAPASIQSSLSSHASPLALRSGSPFPLVSPPLPTGISASLTHIPRVPRATLLLTPTRNRRPFDSVRHPATLPRLGELAVAPPHAEQRRRTGVATGHAFACISRSTASRREKTAAAAGVGWMGLTSYPRRCALGTIWTRCRTLP